MQAVAAVVAEAAEAAAATAAVDSPALHLLTLTFNFLTCGPFGGQRSKFNLRLLCPALLCSGAAIRCSLCHEMRATKTSSGMQVSLAPRDSDCSLARLFA